MITYRIKETFNRTKMCIQYQPQIKFWFIWINLGDGKFYLKTDAEMMIDNFEEANKYKTKYHNYKPE